MTAVMDIILIRHATAVEADGTSRDIGRVLTAKGREDMAALLPRLRLRLMPGQRLVIWSSPADRALETAQIIARGLGVDKISCFHWIYSGNFEAFRRALRLVDSGAALLVVGHEPHLSSWSEALSGEWISFKKCGMLCLRLTDEAVPEARRLWAIRVRYPDAADEAISPTETLTTRDYKYALLRMLYKILGRYRRFLQRPGFPSTTHKLRVSIRQARSLLSFIRPTLGNATFDDGRARLKAIQRQFGYLREIDVLMAQWLAYLDEDSVLPGSGLALALAQEREMEQARLEEYARGPVIAGTLFTLLARVSAWDEAALEEKSPFAPFAARRFEKWHKTAGAAMAKLDYQDHGDIHALRIRYKKLRYVSEAFPSLGAGLETGLQHLAALQDDLGIICDSYANIPLLEDFVKASNIPGMAEDAGALTLHLLELKAKILSKYQEK